MFRFSPGKVSAVFWLLGVVVLLSAACASSAAPTATPAAPTPAAKAVTFANPDLLVETEWLAPKLSDSGIRIVDARKSDEYKSGHIPGSVNIPQESAFLPGAAQGIVGTADQIAKLFGDQGITNDTRVIIYDAGKAYNAPYLLWALEYYGHQKVSVLNGGFTKWQKENRATSTTEPTVTPATLTVKADPTKRALLADMKAALGNPKIAIVDSRSPEEYRGDKVSAKQGGHIPGAVNVDWVNLFNADGTFKSAADMAKLYEDKAVTKDKPVIVH